MLKVDARILGFSVTASEDRINVGDIDTVWDQACRGPNAARKRKKRLTKAQLRARACINKTTPPKRRNRNKKQ